MFIGEYRYSIDAKGRLALPARFRSYLGETAVVTRGLDSCLFIYPISEWQKVVGELNNLPLARANARAYARFFLSGAYEIAFDKLGRCIIPAPLRQYATITKEAAIIGLGTRIEVWDSELWGRYRQKTETESGEISENLMI